MNKLPIWDILTGVILLGIVCMACGFLNILTSESTPLNPFPRPLAYTQIVISIPTATATPTVGVVQEMPPTWTPTIPGEQSTQSEGEAAQPTSTRRPTWTIAPTNTLHIAPTITPFPSASPLPSATSANARCFVMDETPKDNAEFNPNQNFTKEWVLKNNSGKTWSSNASDVQFTGGEKMQTDKKDAYDLPSDVSNSGTIRILIPMTAPGSKGTYIGNWSISGEGGSLCKFYVKIVVK